MPTDFRPFTLRDYVTQRLLEDGDSFAEVESHTFSDAALDAEFDCSSLESFTIWTATRVYFPAHYDGTTWIDCVSRHPDGKATDPKGG